MSLEEIKKRKLQELKKNLEKQKEDQAQLHQQIDMVENFAKKYLDSKAISRFGNLKAAHPEKAIQVTAVIVQAVQSGQIQQKLSDEQFKQLLMNMESKKREIKITRK